MNKVLFETKREPTLIVKVHGGLCSCPAGVSVCPQANTRVTYIQSMGNMLLTLQHNTNTMVHRELVVMIK